MTEAPTLIAAGDVIDGRYRVEALLGQGGMAVVYRARHVGTGSPCAVKLVHPHLVRRRELVELFLREAQVGARIGKNPHIVELFDAGIDPSREVPYLAMELLEGETVDERIVRRGPMERAALRVVFQQIADALDQAHRAGVVHRDLKPTNLFLAASPDGDIFTKVMDFGVAKVLEVDAVMTASSVGTPAYAAPEQLGAAMRALAATHGVTLSAATSPATDVWPLGLIAYEALTGHASGQYWATQTPIEIPLKAVLHPIDSPHLRAGDRSELLPPGFDTWFARCLERNAADRWPSVGEAVLALATLLDGTGGAETASRGRLNPIPACAPGPLTVSRRVGFALRGRPS